MLPAKSNDMDHLGVEAKDSADKEAKKGLNLVLFQGT